MDAHDHGSIPDDPIEFAEAIARFRQLVPMTDEEYAALTEAEQDFAFTVANVAQADLVAEVYDAIDSAIATGTTFDDFQGAVGDSLTEAWGDEDAGRLSTIFRTNVMDAYSSGRYDVMTAPAVAEARPYWRYDAVGDGGRTCEICEPCDGVVLPQDHAWWSRHYPILHPNCFPPGVRVATSAGLVPIELLRAGQLALSHDGRFHRIARVMARAYDGELRVLRGGDQVLHVTANHPIAAQDRWVRADALDIHRDQAWVSKSASAVADDAPAGGGHGVFKASVVGQLLRRRVPLAAIKLNRQLRHRNAQVSVEHVDRQLRHVVNASRGERSGHGALMFAAEHALSTKGPASTRRHRIARAATSRVGGLNLCAPCAFIHGPVAAGVVLAQRAHDTRSFQDARDGHSAAPVTSGKRDRGLPFEVQRDDVLLRESELRGHGFILSRIDSDARKYTGIVYNLEIDETRTFVAEGFLVHNCRCIATPLSEDEAKDGGITGSPPDVDPAPGFGTAPAGGGGSDWEPDTSNYPAAIGDELESRLEDEPDSAAG